MCARTSKKASVGEYCRQRDIQRKKTFAGLRLGEIKKNVPQLVCRMQKIEERREREREREEVSSIHCDVVLEIFFFFFFFFYYKDLLYQKNGVGG